MAAPPTKHSYTIRELSPSDKLEIEKIEKQIKELQKKRQDLKDERHSLPFDDKNTEMKNKLQAEERKIHAKIGGLENKIRSIEDPPAPKPPTAEELKVMIQEMKEEFSKLTKDSEEWLVMKYNISDYEYRLEKREKQEATTKKKEYSSSEGESITPVTSPERGKKESRLHAPGVLNFLTAFKGTKLAQPIAFKNTGPGATKVMKEMYVKEILPKIRPIYATLYDRFNTHDIPFALEKNQINHKTFWEYLRHYDPDLSPKIDAKISPVVWDIRRSIEEILRPGLSKSERGQEFYKDYIEDDSNFMYETFPRLYDMAMMNKSGGAVTGSMKGEDFKAIHWATVVSSVPYEFYNKEIFDSSPGTFEAEYRANKGSNHPIGMAASGGGKMAGAEGFSAGKEQLEKELDEVMEEKQGIVNILQEHSEGAAPAEIEEMKKSLRELVEREKRLREQLDMKIPKGGIHAEAAALRKEKKALKEQLGGDDDGEIRNKIAMIDKRLLAIKRGEEPSDDEDPPLPTHPDSHIDRLQRIYGAGGYLGLLRKAQIGAHLAPIPMPAPDGSNLMLNAFRFSNYRSFIENHMDKYSPLISRHARYDPIATSHDIPGRLNTAYNKMKVSGIDNPIKFRGVALRAIG